MGGSPCTSARNCKVYTTHISCPSSQQRITCTEISPVSSLTENTPDFQILKPPPLQVNSKTPLHSQGSHLNSGQAQAATWTPPTPHCAQLPDGGARGKGLCPGPPLAEPRQRQLRLPGREKAVSVLALHRFSSRWFLYRFGPAFSMLSQHGSVRGRKRQPRPRRHLGEGPSASGRRHLGGTPGGPPSWEGTRGGGGGRAILGRSARLALGSALHGFMAAADVAGSESGSG